MASFIKTEGNDKFPKPKIGKTPFLSSIRDFQPEGVKLGVERVSKVFPVKQNPEKAQLTVEFVIMEDMPKIRLYDINDDNEYVIIKDELTGKDQKKIIIGEIKEDDIECFPIFFPCGTPKEIDNDADLTFYPTSSAYPLFKFALQNAGELPADAGDKAFATTQKELKEALEGLVFTAKCEEIKGKFNYMRMQVEEAEL